MVNLMDIDPGCVVDMQVTGPFERGALYERAAGPAPPTSDPPVAGRGKTRSKWESGFLLLPYSTPSGRDLSMAAQFVWELVSGILGDVSLVR
ncbi:hypothetical protein GB937_010471 [Aspergillus fischeri]|nr:hypothetical protein GB937_010471 [Aspergillus fischeri]